MPLKTNCRAAIIVLLALLFVGFTASQSIGSNSASQISSSFKAGMVDDWNDDSTSPVDFHFLPLAQVIVPLTFLLILIAGIRPRPAAASFAVNYPVLPQGPPR